MNLSCSFPGREMKSINPFPGREMNCINPFLGQEMVISGPGNGHSHVESENLLMKLLGRKFHTFLHKRSFPLCRQKCSI